MQPWIAVLVWGLNVLALSLPLAIFEILLEKQNGWGSALNPNGWGRRLFAGTIVSDLCEKSHLTVYHLFVFVVVMPSILFGELWIVERFAIGHPAYSHALGSSGAYLVMQIGQVKLMPLFYLIAAWFSLLGVEDILWFALNWYHPTSWTDLLSGRIHWHTRWVSLGSIKLPRFYVTTQLAAAVLLTGSLLAARWL